MPDALEELDSVPHVAPLQPLPERAQVTPLFCESFCTIAVNGCEAPLCTLALLGLGLDDLSMGPFFIPVIKRIIRSVSYAAARNIARDVLTMATVKEVKGHLFDGMKSFGIIERSCRSKASLV